MYKTMLLWWWNLRKEVVIPFFLKLRITSNIFLNVQKSIVWPLGFSLTLWHVSVKWVILCKIYSLYEHLSVKKNSIEFVINCSLISVLGQSRYSLEYSQMFFQITVLTVLLTCGLGDTSDPFLADRNIDTDTNFSKKDLCNLLVVITFVFRHHGRKNSPFLEDIQKIEESWWLGDLPRHVCLSRRLRLL